MISGTPNNCRREAFRRKQLDNTVKQAIIQHYIARRILAASR